MLDRASLKILLDSELATDRVSDDVTSRLLGEAAHTPAVGLVFAKQAGVFSGLAVLEAFEMPGLSVEPLVGEGATLEVGAPVARLHGPVVACLTAERTLLNLLSHLSGVATQTRRFVEAVRPHHTKILATRKTLPGLRDLQLQAVRAGGGHVHRRSLSDGILVKDNHLMFIEEAAVVKRAKEMRSPLHRVEVEVQSLEQLDRLLINPPDIIMLDNLPPETMREALRRIGGRSEVEISGGVTLEQVPTLAALGVHYISVGRLTHSATALDLSMDIRAEAP
ncbi:carboxylating nicotinate-nucleotide diphosphorylase [bacterium]|nr:carboxylating nicotinate-nucleotide diphosphorylase [bacterium]